MAFTLTEALLKAKSSKKALFSSGIPALDEIVGTDVKGIAKGEIVEISGPPGVGKHEIALNIVSQCINDGQNAVWISCGRGGLPCMNRLEDAKEPVNPSLKLLRITRVPSLAQLLVIALRDVGNISDASVIVLDDLGCLVSTLDGRSNSYSTTETKGTKAKSKSGQEPSSKRNRNLQFLFHNLQRKKPKLIIILDSMKSRRRPQGLPKAVMGSILAGGSWEAFNAKRIIMYRDGTGTTNQHSTEINQRWAEYRQQLYCLEPRDRGTQEVMEIPTSLKRGLTSESGTSSRTSSPEPAHKHSRLTRLNSSSEYLAIDEIPDSQEWFDDEPLSISLSRRVEV